MCLSADANKYVLLSVIYSSVFYWFWMLYSDCYHLTGSDIGRFPIDLSDFGDKKEVYYNLYKMIVESMDMHKERVVYKQPFGVLEYDQFSQRMSKKEYDFVDDALAEYYGLSDEELDYIKNYDYEFRQGE